MKLFYTAKSNLFIIFSCVNINPVVLRLYCKKANLQEAKPKFAELPNTNLEYANLEGAILYEHNSSIYMDLLIDKKQNGIQRV